jgi:hypothetical protein
MLLFLFLLSLPLLSSPLPPSDEAVSPDGIRLLAEGGRGRHAAVRPAEIRLLAEGGQGRHASDGFRLQGEGGQRLLARSKERVAVSPTMVPISNAAGRCPATRCHTAVSPSGIRLLVEGGRGRHAAVSLHGIRLLAEGGSERPATVSPSGTRLLAECWLGRAAVSPNGTRLSAEGELGRF